MTELNLSDPDTLKAVLSASVTDVPPSFQNDEQVAAAAVSEKLKPAQAIKAKVEAAAKTATFTLKLTADQLTQTKRHSIEAGFGDDWQSFLASEIANKIFSGPVASPRISKPSWAKGNVVGPSGW